jgi:hypothetical protein
LLGTRICFQCAFFQRRRIICNEQLVFFQEAYDYMAVLDGFRKNFYIKTGVSENYNLLSSTIRKKIHNTKIRLVVAVVTSTTG